MKEESHRNTFINRLKVTCENTISKEVLLLKTGHKKIEELTEEQKLEAISFLKKEIASKKKKLQKL